MLKIIDVGDEDELESFPIELVEALSASTGHSSEEESMHGWFMHTMESPPPINENTPLTACITHDFLHR